MRKIVINTCAGGFNLSKEAVLLYASKKKLKLFTEDDPVVGERLTHYYTVPRNEWDYEEETGDEYYFNPKRIPRDDPTLIQVVETLKEKANTEFSDLAVISIPPSVNWEIYEQNGEESIHEVHRIWKA